jgi:hypothetical protein
MITINIFRFQSHNIFKLIGFWLLFPKDNIISDSSNRWCEKENIISDSSDRLHNTDSLLTRVIRLKYFLRPEKGAFDFKNLKLKKYFYNLSKLN